MNQTTTTMLDRLWRDAVVALAMLAAVWLGAALVASVL
jgi:hypothetical protein